MKKLLFLLCFLNILLTSCEKDDAGISGEVTYNLDGESTPINGAVVRLYKVKLASDGKIEGDSNLTPLEEVTTNSKGQYAFTNLNEGNYWITAVATIEGEVYGTSPYAPVGLYLPSGQSEKKDIVISLLD